MPEERRVVRRVIRLKKKKKAPGASAGPSVHVEPAPTMRQYAPPVPVPKPSVPKPSVSQATTVPKPPTVSQATTVSQQAAAAVQRPRLRMRPPPMPPMPPRAPPSLTRPQIDQNDRSSDRSSDRRSDRSDETVAGGADDLDAQLDELDDADESFDDVSDHSDDGAARLSDHADHTVRDQADDSIEKPSKMDRILGLVTRVEARVGARKSDEVTRLTVQPPNVVGGTMRPHQILGLNWLVQLHHQGVNGILADEMGLGKTLQTISLLAYLAHFEQLRGPFLVVVPKSTLPNWLKEFRRWCPSLRVRKILGEKEERTRQKQEILDSWAYTLRQRRNGSVSEVEEDSDSDAVAVASDHSDQDTWQEHDDDADRANFFDGYQASESVRRRRIRQRKLEERQVRRALRRKGADAEGPLEVVVTTFELVTLDRIALSAVHWEYVVVDEAHRLKNVQSRLARTLSSFESKQRLLLTGTPLQNNLGELWALLNFLMPEVFDDVAAFEEIFERGEEESNEEDDKKILQLLHRVLQPLLLRRRKADVAKSLPKKTEVLLFVPMSQLQRDLYKAILSRQLDALQGKVRIKASLLNVVMELRKVCNHPYLFDGVEDRSLPALGRHLIDNSGKLRVLEKLLAKLKKQQSRVLVFTQMTKQLDILEDFCRMLGHQYRRIDGQTAAEDREKRIEEFNADGSEIFCFLLSTRSGGLGINLATADIVVIFDSDWNPQMDLQAQDRAHRIGQKKPVFVYRFITEGSIEEKVLERAELKLRLDAMVIQQGKAMTATQQQKLSKDEMLAMIRCGADQIFKSQGEVTDSDIDLLLDRSKKRQQELQSKLQTYEQKGTFSLDSLNNVNAAMSVLGADVTLDMDAITRAAEEHQRQHLGLTGPSVEGGRRRAALQAAQATARQSRSLGLSLGEQRATGKQMRRMLLEGKPRPLPVMNDWQFWDSARLRQLHEREVEFYAELQAWLNKHGAQADILLAEEGLPDKVRRKQLKQREVELFERLLTAGFAKFSRRDHQRFVRLCARYGRHRADVVAKKMAQMSAASTQALQLTLAVEEKARVNAEKKKRRPTGAKLAAQQQQRKALTEQDVLDYHAVFWREGQRTLSEWERIEKQVAKGEQNYVKMRRSALILKQWLREWPEDERWKYYFKYPSQHKYKGYTRSHDRLLLELTARIEYGDWTHLLSLLRRHDAVARTCVFLKSRSPLELGRRVDTLVRLIAKDVDLDAVDKEEAELESARLAFIRQGSNTEATEDGTVKTLPAGIPLPPPVFAPPPQFHPRPAMEQPAPKRQKTRHDDNENNNENNDESSNSSVYNDSEHDADEVDDDDSEMEESAGADDEAALHDDDDYGF